MARKLEAQGLDTLAQRFQVLRDRIGAMPGACRAELAGALQDLSQAIAALQPGQEAPAGQAGKKLPPMKPEAQPTICETILPHVFDAIPDLITIIDRDLNIVMSNWHRPEVPEKLRFGQPKCYRVYHRRDRPCEDCHVLKVFATGLPQKVEKTNDYDGRILEFRAFPVLDESGQVSLVVEHVRDIQERHLAEQALRESEDRFRTLIEDSPESLFLTDVQGTILAASRVAAQRVGKNLAEIIGANSFDLLPPEVAVHRRRWFDQAVTTGRPVYFEDVRGGMHFSISFNPILDAEGKVSRLSTLAIDITDRKRAEQALKEKTRLNQLLLDALPCVAFLLRPRTHEIIAANAEGVKVGGLPGAQCFSTWGKREDPCPWCRAPALWATGEAQHVEVEALGVAWDAHWIPVAEDLYMHFAFDVTARKQAESARRESEATLRTLIEANPESLFLLDTRGIVLAASRVAAQRLGKSLEEIIGTDLHGMLPPEVSRRRYEIMQRVVATGQPARFEDVRGNFYFDSSITPIFDQGQVTQVAVLGVDITDRKKTEQALRESEARFRAIFATARDSIFIKDRSFRYTQVNPAMEHLFGRPAAEIIGRTDLDLVGAADTNRIRRQDQRVLNGEVVKGAHAVSVQGVPITFHYIKAPLQDDAGDIVGICGIARDITDLKQAEAAFRESEERFRMLFDHAPDAYILADMQGEIIDCNRAAEELAGYGRQELIGNNFACLPWLDFRQQVRLADLLVQAAQGEVMGPVDFTLTRKDGGEIIAEGMSLPLHIQGQNMVLTIVRDVTARKRAEMALRESEELYRSLFDNMLNGFAYHRMLFEQDRPLDYIFLNVNSSFEKITGLKDVVGKKVSEVIPGVQKSDPELFEIYGRVAWTGNPERFEKYVEAMQRWFSVSVYSPAKEYFVTVFDDITARKQADDKLVKNHLKLQEIALRLEQSTNMLHLIIESIPARVFWKDRELRFMGCNTPFARDAGFKHPQELLGQDDFAMGWREQADNYRADDLQVMESRRPKLNLVEPQTTPTGAKIWLSTNKVPLQMPNGEVFGVLGVYEDITERRLAEEALAEQRELMHYVIRHDPNAIAVYDNELRYVFVSERYLNDYGIQGQDIIGKHHYEVFPEMPQRWKEVHQRVLAGAVERSDDDYFERSDGSITYNRWECRPWYRADGRIGGMITYTEVTTERKLAEAALRESEQRFRNITENAVEWVWEVNPQGQYTYSSPVVQQLLGYVPEDILGKYFYDFFLPDKREELKNAVLEAFATKQPFRDFVNPNLHKDGRIVWLSSSGTPILDEQGNLMGYRGADIDITARRQAEAELRESEQRFRLMAETIQDVFWVATPTLDRVIYASPAYEQVWGYSCQDLYRNPQRFVEGIHPEDRDRVLAEIVTATEQGSPYDQEYRIIRPDGAGRWIHDRGFPVRDAQGRIILFTGVATDVTEHKALEGQLLQAQKMEAVGRLAGGVAHDFNNLLMAIMGYGELMRAKVLKDDPLYGYLEVILKAGERAAALTNQLLTFSRQQIVHPQVIDLNGVVLDLEPMLRRLIGEDLDLEVITDRRPGAVKADPGQMGQIIMNLVVNARDAMPQGGRLSLKIAVVDLTEGRHCRFGLAPPGAYVRLEVRDTGVGMAETIQAHVFEPFFTTKEPGKGTGLGLSTVYGIVQQSGGYLDLASEPGVGSIFTIYLPRIEGVVEPPKAKVPITASCQGEETILLVEDEDMLRGLLAKFLRLCGYTVLEARHGGEALLACERHLGPIHLMVTDVVMPQMSGRELTDRLTPLRPEMRVLYMSGYTEDALVQHGVADLSVAFLQKPFRPIELARRVHAVLHPPVIP